MSPSVKQQDAANGSSGVRLRTAVSALVFLEIFAIPQYWLWGEWGLFFPSWALVLAAGIVVPLHFCRHCQHRRCPMNLVQFPAGSDAQDA